MKRILIVSALIVAGLMRPSLAEALQEHTFLIAWASGNCENFDYAPDLLQHAVAEVQSAPEAEVRPFEEEVIGGLHAIYEGDRAEICETVFYLIDTPEEE